MKKFINKFLKDKNDFHRDIDLRAINDSYAYILNEERKLLTYMVRENLRYFFRYKKLYMSKVFVVFLGYLSIVGLFIGIGLFTLDYFGVVRISKPLPRAERQFVVYVPDTDTLAQMECQKRKIKYITMFLPDSKKNWKTYKKRFQQIEAKGMSDINSYFALSGQYWGRYQMGNDARAAVGLGNVTWKEYSTNPDMQEGAFLAWIRLLKKDLQPEINRYTGAVMNNVQLTESGIIALGHNMGSGGCRAFLRSNGTTVPINGIPMAFVKIGGYKIDVE